jgi:hypothetical protein
MVIDPTLDRRHAAEPVLTVARRMIAQGSRLEAVDVIDNHLRGGLWDSVRLWKELVALMDEPSDYHRIRQLWLDAPRRCHGSLAITRAVARAASAAGEHDDARLLLRRAIVTRARSQRRLRTRLRRVKSTAVSSLRSVIRPERPAEDEAFDRRAAVALAALSAELEKLGVKAFLISGTLLGYLREGNFISWDKDIDVGVFTSDIKLGDIESAFRQAPEFSVRRLDFNSDRLRVDHVNGVKVDIFPHYFVEADGKVWHDGTATRWWNSPFDMAEIEFLGERQYVPEDPERYLDENYGNWRVPEPNFDARIDAPNVEVTDQDYFNTLLYFSLLEAVAKRNDVKRKRYTRLLRDLGENGWLDEL